MYTGTQIQAAALYLLHTQWVFKLFAMVVTYIYARWYHDFLVCSVDIITNIYVYINTVRSFYGKHNIYIQLNCVEWTLINFFFGCDACPDAIEEFWTYLLTLFEAVCCFYSEYTRSILSFFVVRFASNLFLSVSALRRRRDALLAWDQL